MNKTITIKHTPKGEGMHLDHKEAVIKAAEQSSIDMLKMYEKASQVQILKWLLENATTGDWRRVVSLKIEELKK